MTLTLLFVVVVSVIGAGFTTAFSEACRYLPADPDPSKTWSDEDQVP